MGITRQILRYFLFGNFFVSIGAALAMWGTAYLFDLKLHYCNYVLMLLGTLCAYSFHWYLTPYASYDREREAWTLEHKRLLLVLCVSAFVAGIAYGVVHRTHIKLLYYVPLIIFTFVYSAPKIPVQPFVRLRKMVMAKTLYLTIGWWYATSYLPILLGSTQASSHASPYLWYRFLLIFTICFVFDYRDKSLDILSGIKTVLKFVSLPFASLVCQVLLALCCVAITNVFGTVSTAELCLLAIPVCVLVLVHQYSLQHAKDVWYYGVLDAMLFVSAGVQLLLVVLGL
jgi:hypothetical protein